MQRDKLIIIFSSGQTFVCARTLFDFMTLCDPHRLEPTKLLCPWDFPGKNTGAISSPGDLPHLGIEPGSPALQAYSLLSAPGSPALQAYSLLSAPRGSPFIPFNSMSHFAVPHQRQLFRCALCASFCLCVCLPSVCSTSVSTTHVALCTSHAASVI